MKQNKKETDEKVNGKHEHPLPQEIKEEERVAAEKAHEVAEKDIEKDPDLSIHSPNDDLDEGETARLGEDKTDLI
jgi:hypothetical protein